MPTDFPGALDDFTTRKPGPTSFEDDPAMFHDVVHVDEMDAIAAMQAKLGVDGSGDPTTIDARLAAAEASLATASASSYEATNKEGATIVAGQAVATHSSGTGVVLARALGQTKPAVGLMQSATLNNVAGPVQTDGLFTLADWTAITGAATLTRGLYYLDPTTPGKLTATAPTADGQIVQVVGYAVSTTDLDLSISTPLLL